MGEELSKQETKREETLDPKKIIEEWVRRKYTGLHGLPSESKEMDEVVETALELYDQAEEYYNVEVSAHQAALEASKKDEIGEAADAVMVAKYFRGKRMTIVEKMSRMAVKPPSADFKFSPDYKEVKKFREQIPALNPLLITPKRS